MTLTSHESALIVIPRKSRFSVNLQLRAALVYRHKNKYLEVSLAANMFIYQNNTILVP